ncbi:MAG: pyridoxal phosphate-dependent aminotransferase [Candidatus Marinimicrobia bacterium]|nr:pyridoxal phosphate-dependent aminotransferase [Candidatus Neomarinimicrobiota bacterium]
MSISQLAKSIPTSPTLALNDTARILKEKGEAVIHLGGGEPKSKAPIDAILSASAKLNSAEIKYTPTEGILPLRKAIVRYTEENYDHLISTKNIIISNGAKQSLSVLLQSIVDPQDEVIVLAPYWVSYPEMIKMAYGKPVVVTPEDGRLEPTMEDIIPSVGSYTKAIIVNSPSNPSGAIYSKGLIEALVKYCEKKDIYLIMDDIYHKLVFDGETWTSPYQFAKTNDAKSKLVIVNGVSKAYAMTGFRVGWTIANPTLIEAMVNIQAQTTSCVSGLTQAGAVGALNGIQSGVESLRITLQNNRDIMLNELRTIEGVRVEKPGGTFYCFPDFSAYEKSAAKLSKLLLDKVRVVTVPGNEFGMDGHLRLSYCGSIKDIKEGVERIKWALDPNAPNEIFVGDRKLVRDWS